MNKVGLVLGLGVLGIGGVALAMAQKKKGSSGVALGNVIMVSDGKGGYMYAQVRADGLYPVTVGPNGIYPANACGLPTEVTIMQVNYAILSKNRELVQAVAQVFDNYGCIAEKNAMYDWLKSNGVSDPDITLIDWRAVPSSNRASDKPGQILLKPGETWRAVAVLGGIGCAVGLDTIAQKVQEKGFSQVSVYKANPGWGSDWNAPEGFLECTRYVQATVIGNERWESKPKQIYKVAKIA